MHSKAIIIWQQHSSVQFCLIISIFTYRIEHASVRRRKKKKRQKRLLIDANRNVQLCVDFGVAHFPPSILALHRTPDWIHSTIVAFVVSVLLGATFVSHWLSRRYTLELLIDEYILFLTIEPLSVGFFNHFVLNALRGITVFSASTVQSNLSTAAFRIFDAIKFSFTVP